MPNGNGNTWHESIPSWAKTFAFLVGTVGMPIIISAYFMAMNVGILYSPAAKNEKVLDRLAVDFYEEMKTMKSAIDKRDRMWEKFLHVQVATCRNAARNPDQARDCDYWRSP